MTLTENYDPTKARALLERVLAEGNAEHVFHTPTGKEIDVRFSFQGKSLSISMIEHEHVATLNLRHGTLLCEADADLYERLKVIAQNWRKEQERIRAIRFERELSEYEQLTGVLG